MDNELEIDQDLEVHRDSCPKNASAIGDEQKSIKCWAASHCAWLHCLPACLPGIIWCDDYHLLFSCIPAELEAEVNEETRWCLVLAKNSLEAPEQFMMCEPEVVHTWAAAAAVLGIPSRSVCTSINEIESDNIVGKLIAQQPRRLSVWRERPNILCVKGLSSH